MKKSRKYRIQVSFFPQSKFSLFIYKIHNKFIINKFSNKQSKRLESLIPLPLRDERPVPLSHLPQIVLLIKNSLPASFVMLGLGVRVYSNMENKI